MTQDVSYTPARQNNLPVIVVSGAALVMLICAVFMMFKIGRALLFQTLFLIAACLMIFFFVRYLSSSYTYTINQTDGYFVVTQRKGKRIATLCNMSLASLYRVRPYEEQDASEKKSADRYAYCISMRPAFSTLLFFKDGSRNVTVRIETCDDFYQLLNQIAEKNLQEPHILDEEGDY